MLITLRNVTLSHQYMKLLKLLLNAIVAWILGIAAIAALLYFTNGGADFTVTDLTGLLCNVPITIFLLTLVNRKMVLTEALGFIVTFLIIGSVFGFGFTLATD